MLLLAVLALAFSLTTALPALATPPSAEPGQADAVAVSEPTPAPGEPTPAPAEPTVAPGQPTAAPSTPSPYDWPDGEPCPLPEVDPTPPAPGASPRPLPLCPAEASANPIDFLAWLFTPIFQALFLGMVAFYNITGDIGIGIILLTLVIKTILIPLFRRQIVSQRRMQLLQPEMRAIQQKFKGNRAKVSEETMRLYRERNINPAAGCLPTILQLFLLIPIYQVVARGLSAPDISAMLNVFGQRVINVACQVVPPNPDTPCIDPTISWLGWLPAAGPGGLDAHVPEILFSIPLPVVGAFGISLLALMAAGLQLVQTRMMIPKVNDPQIRSQQRIFMLIPLISIVYGGFLPAGLFLYWIVFTAYSIVQQYLIVGWGSMFPLFGWNPAFAREHTPRFAIAEHKPPEKAESAEKRKDEPRRSPSDSAAGTIRPARSRGRTSRRGRRR